MGNVGAKFVETNSSNNALSATEAQLAYTTKRNTLKQKKVLNFTTSVTLSGSSNDYEEVVFTHNLGRRPAYKISFEDHDGAMIEIPGRSDDLADPSCGIIVGQTNNAITVRVGYYGGATHAHQHVRKILCKVYVESEIT